MLAMVRTKTAGLCPYFAADGSSGGLTERRPLLHKPKCALTSVEVDQIGQDFQ